MADNSNDDLRRRMEAQEQTSKAQQEALDNIQKMLAQLLTNRNNNNTGRIIMGKNFITWTIQGWEIKGKFFYGCWSS